MTGRVWLPPQSGAAGQFDESVPAGTQRAFLPSLLGWPLLLAPLNAFERGVIPPVEQTTPARAEFLLPSVFLQEHSTRFAHNSLTCTAFRHCI